MNRPPYRRIWAVGETGSGKSRLLTFIASEAAQEGQEVWVLDCLDCMQVHSAAMRATPDEDANLESAGPYYEWVGRWAGAAFDRARETGRPLMLIVDEADLACRRGEAPPALIRVVMQGRKYGVSYAFATRRPVEIPTSLRSQADDLYVFRLREPRDIDAVAARGLDDADVMSLPVGHFWHRNHAHVWHLHDSAFRPCA